MIGCHRYAGLTIAAGVLATVVSVAGCGGNSGSRAIDAAAEAGTPTDADASPDVPQASDVPPDTVSPIDDASGPDMATPPDTLPEVMDDAPPTQCVLPKTWSDNLSSISAQCVPCARINCCPQINACAANAECLAIYHCEQNCYEGIGPDGGVVPDDDAGTDDAGNTAMDRCVIACIAAGSSAARNLFADQDGCVNGALPTECGKKDVCD